MKQGQKTAIQCETKKIAARKFLVHFFEESRTMNGIFAALWCHTKPGNGSQLFRIIALWSRSDECLLVAHPQLSAVRLVHRQLSPLELAAPATPGSNLPYLGHGSRHYV